MTVDRETPGTAASIGVGLALVGALHFSSLPYAAAPIQPAPYVQPNTQSVNIPLTPTGKPQPRRETPLAPALQRISQLEDGWDGTGSKAVPEATLRLAQKFLNSDPRIRDNASIGPYAEGTVVVEWRSGDLNCIAEFFEDGTIDYSEDNLVTDEFREYPLSLTELEARTQKVLA